MCSMHFHLIWLGFYRRCINFISYRIFPIDHSFWIQLYIYMKTLGTDHAVELIIDLSMFPIRGGRIVVQMRTAS